MRIVAACVAALVAAAPFTAFAQTYGSPNFQGITITIPGNSYGGVTTAPAAVGSAPSAQAQETATWNPTYSGGSGAVKNVRLNQSTIYGAMTDFDWVNLNLLNYSGTGGANAQHVATYNQTNRYAWTAGGTANNPQLWAEVNECNDFTHQPSSVNAFPCVEIDQIGSGLDAYGRQLTTGIIKPSTETGALGYFVAEGYSVYVGPGGYANGGYGFGGAYIGALEDFRYACSYGQNQSSLSGNCTAVTVTSNTTSSSTLPVSNVVPFTRDPFNRDLNAYHTPTYIWIGSTQYQITGYSITGTGAAPAGTLTLTGPISATSGTNVYAQSNIVWLPTGHSIALDTYGATQVWSDGTTIHLVGGLNVTGTVAGAGVTSLFASPPAIGGTTPAAGTFSTLTGGTVVAANQFKIASATPTIASGACGTGTNGTITGSAQSGKITIGAAATTVCTVTASYTTAPNACTITPATSASAATTVLPYISSISSSGFVLSGAVLASTSFYFQCI